MKKLLIPGLAFVMALFAACSDTAVNTDKSEILKAGENFTFIESASRAEHAEKNRSSDISDPFEINDVSINDVDGKKLMYIDVTQSLGCEETYSDKFEVIWDGIMLMIYPPQVGFYLTFNSDGCAELAENVEETIVLDLYEIFESETFVDSAHFTVINASKSTADNDHKTDR